MRKIKFKISILLLALTLPSLSYGAEPQAKDTTTFKDPRDNQTYKIVQIGTQAWMAENLNFKANSGSWCYDNKPGMCAKYGRLYDWETAKKACPSGWHLPSKDEWEVLASFVGSHIGNTRKNNSGWTRVGGALKAISGWKAQCLGVDRFGFVGLPAGLRHSNGVFDLKGKFGLWWSASLYESDMAYNFIVACSHTRLNLNWSSLSEGYSVRCVMNN